MISDFCDNCKPIADRLNEQVQEREEALVKSDRVRAQLRTAAETLQKRLAQTQKQLRLCQHASASSNGTDSPTRLPSHDPSSNSVSDGSSSPSHAALHEERVCALMAEVTRHRRRSELDNKELTALQSEVSQRRRQSQVDEQELVALQREAASREAESEGLARELEQFKRKLSQSEALAQDRLQELELVRSTWVSPVALQRVKNELAELKAKDDARVTNPMDALDSLQRDLEDAASWRKASMSDAHKKAQLTLEVAELQDTMNRLSHENAQYKLAVSKLEEEASGLRTACMHSTSSVVQRYDDLRSELKMLRDERRDTYARMGVLEEENKHLRSVHDEGRAQRMESELRNLSVEIERLRSCNTALCSQLFGDEARKADGDLAVNMLLQGQRPMDADDDELGEGMHIKAIARLQHLLTNAEEKHLTEKEQLMEKVREMERNAAARLAPLQRQRESPKAPPVARLSTANTLSSLMPTSLSAISWSSFVSK